MSNLSTLPKGDSAWLLRKAIERIIQQVSVLETNIGASTSGNSANTQIIFNDAGVLRGDAGLVYNKTTDTLTAGNATITGAATVGTTLGVTGDLSAAANSILGTGSKATDTLLDFKADTGTQRIYLDRGGRNLIFKDVTTNIENYRITGVTGVQTWGVGGSTAMTLNSTGLGIGTTTPAYKLEVATGTSGQQALASFRTADTTAANNAGIQIYATPSSTAASRSVLLSLDADGADASGGDYFIIQKLGNSGQVDLTQQSNAAMTFSTNGTERARITASGDVNITTGNVVMSTSGKGIDFSATANSSGTMTSELLNDYEEGTFTPTVTSVGGTGIVYVAGANDAGKYTKIGNLVSFTVNLNGTYTGTFTYWRIALPFTVGSAYDAVSGYNNSTSLAFAGRTASTEARFIVVIPQSSGDLAIYTGSYNV